MGGQGQGAQGREQGQGPGTVVWLGHSYVVQLMIYARVGAMVSIVCLLVSGVGCMWL